MRGLFLPIALTMRRLWEVMSTGFRSGRSKATKAMSTGFFKWDAKEAHVYAADREVTRVTHLVWRSGDGLEQVAFQFKWPGLSLK